jgi:3-oxoisoapionate decarboxylase
VKLGLHTYSLSAFGVAQAWSGNQHMPPWPRQLSTFELLDRVVEWGLDGVQLDDAVLETLDESYLREVGAAARERGLFLEYDFSLDYAGWGIGIQHDLGEALDTVHALGADVAKLSIDMDRPHPVMASRFHPQVVARLEEVADLLRMYAPAAAERGIRIAVENHTDLFADEVIWLLDQVDHPSVGACVDAMNAGPLLEDVMRAVEVLAPRAFTDHFRDERVVAQSTGYRLVGAPIGQGDVDVRRVYNLIRDLSPCDRIIIENDLDIPLDDLSEALALSEAAVVESIRYCREVLGVGSDDERRATGGEGAGGR